MEKKGIRHILFLIGIMLTSILVMADLPVYVIVNNLYTDFYEQIGVVNFIISGTALTVMIASLITPGLMKKLGKKNTLLCAGIVFLLCSIGCLFVRSAMAIAVLRGICGLSMGAANVTAVAILTDYYDDEIKRAKIIGIYNTCMPLIGSLLSAAAGILAVKGWHNIFHVFWVSIPMMILILLFTPADKSSSCAAEKAAAEKNKMGSAFWIMAVNFFFICLGAMMLQMFYSVYIAEHALGNEAFSGLVNTVVGYGSVLANFTFGFIYAKLGRKIVPLSMLLPILGCLILMFLPGRITIFIAYFIILAGYGFGFSGAYAYTPTLCPKEASGKAIGIATAVYAAAGFLATYAVTTLQSLLHIETFTGVIPIVMGLFIVLLAVEIILPSKLKKAV